MCERARNLNRRGPRCFPLLEIILTSIILACAVFASAAAAQSITVRGKVTDAKTGQPIPEFQVLIGERDPVLSDLHDPVFDENDVHIFSEGNYEQTIEERVPVAQVMFLEIRAKGYMPVISPTIRDSGKLDFSLIPHGAWGGRVLDSKGKPISGLKFWREFPGASVAFNQLPPISNMHGGPVDAFVVTDSEGRFTLSPDAEEFGLITSTPDGCLFIDREGMTQQRDWNLVPWGRIEGHVPPTTRPVINQFIMAFLLDPEDDLLSNTLARPLDTQDATVDADGQFHFDRIAPGVVRLTRVAWVGPGQPKFTIIDDLNVAPGQTSKLNWSEGMTGRPVEGRGIFPEPLLNTNSNFVVADSMQITLPPVPDPDKKSPRDMRNWYRSYFKTDAGAALLKAESKRHDYWSQLDSSGNFRFDEMLAGTYEIRAWTGSINRYFLITVPPMPEGATHATLKLPAINAADMKLESSMGPP